MSGSLSTMEIATAENLWLTTAQVDSFKEEVEALKKDKPIHKSSCLRFLCPFLDESMQSDASGWSRR